MPVEMKFDKRFFFDRKLVEDIVGKTAAKALGKAGAFVQRRARSSMRRAGKRARAERQAGRGGEGSSPGTPPRAWSLDSVASLKNIQFQFVPKTMSVFVGPMKLNMGGSSGQAPIPGLHEQGGTTRILEWRFNQLDVRNSWMGWKDYRSSAKFSNEWRRRDLRWRDASRKRRSRTLSKLGVETRTRMATYPARPFMGPALKKEMPKFPTLFARTA